MLPDDAARGLRAEAPSKSALPDNEVARVVRGGLGSVKRCYLLEEQNGGGSGKAIVTFTIEPTGSVGGVRVDAPAFSHGRLPACVGQQVRGWTFPRFSGPSVTVTYPFVFVGT
jgi:hypothetical protein